MTVKTAGFLLALAMLAILGLGLWFRYGQPRRIVATGSLTVQSETQPETVATLRTRTVMIGSVRFEEIELPGGTWIDCAGDCRKAAREAGPDLWETIRRNAGGR